MDNTLTQNIIIPCYCADASWRLKVSSFMDYAQEAANIHAGILGFGYDDLIRTHTAWVLSRMHIKFINPPKWRDEVSLKTWHKGLERLFYLRDFEMRDKNGDLAVVATTSWLVLNLDTRRLVREPDLMDANTECHDNAMEAPCDKVQIPKDLEAEFVHNHVVAYSDVDMNGHTNNAVYVLWAMNMVDYDTAIGKPVKEVRINFNHETRPGDKVSLYKAVRRTEDSLIYYIEGKVEAQSSFCVEITF